MKKCPYCSENIENNATKCKYCLELIQGDNLEIEKQEPIQENENKIEGLSGWLFFVIFGLILTPVIVTSFIYSTFIKLLNNGTFSQLIDINSPLYVKNFLALSIYEIICNIILIILSITLIYLFFNKHKLFPLLYKVFVVFNFLFLLFDFLFANLIPEIGNSVDFYESLTQISRAFIMMIVWGTYMHVSIRVKNTFVNTELKKNNYLVNVLLILISFFVIIIFSSIDYKKISNLETNTNLIITKDQKIIKLNNYYSLDYKKNNLNIMNNVKSLNPDASIGFKSKQGSFILIIPEIIDNEIYKNYSYSSDKEVFEVLKSLYEDEFGINISDQYIKKYKNEKIYISLGSTIIEGHTFYYHIGLAINETEALNIYTYGLNQNIVNIDGKNFIDNLE